MIIFSSVGTHQSRKPRWIRCLTLACLLLCHLNMTNYTSAKTRSCHSDRCGLSKWLMPQEGCKEWKHFCRQQMSQDSKCLRCSWAWHSPTFTPVNHGRKYLWLMESQLVAGLSGAAGQGQKCVEVICISQSLHIPGGIDGCLVRPLYVTCSEEQKMQLPASALVWQMDFSEYGKFLLISATKHKRQGK